ncbi:unnamed protein product [Brassica oleracea]
MLMLLTAFSKKILLGIWIVQTLCKIELLKILDINRSKHVSSEDCLESIDKSQFGRQFVEDNSPLSAMNSTQPINQN